MSNQLYTWIVSAANILGRDYRGADRGVFRTPKLAPLQRAVVFGKDLDDNVHGAMANEVSLLRERLPQGGIQELAFGVSRDGRTWAMLVRCRDLDLIDKWIWETDHLAKNGGAQRACDGFTEQTRRAMAVLPLIIAQAQMDHAVSRESYENGGRA